MVTGCAPDAAPPQAPSPSPPASAPAAPSATRAPDPAPPPAPPVSLEPTVTPVTVADLGATWRPGCPVGPERLRRIEVAFLGFDNRTQRGALVVHEDLVGEVIEIFGELYRMRYPVERMRTVEVYPNADDELSMADNNTSAYNCRGIPGSQSWSYHAYGRAIDINPLINPYIDSGGAYQPANAGPYLNRSRIDPGMLHAGDPAVLAFTERGWRWGGDWRTPKDYQHFERR
ncbi:M15 family peptidase [Mycobacterium sp. PS03-16]|uniref:M15 family metallopeptidase n=1 Tax=Mycobacterium sp. PS03-16 TaxID=2559611 RepID=UPI0010739BBD|nr:M15 family metallopeptidase [Mycobacterium sp. PS03-16]TFV59516.1 M15 family peptidase [Mycobacterium sp. PS03-16]